LNTLVEESDVVEERILGTDRAGALALALRADEGIRTFKFDELCFHDDCNIASAGRWILG
jgi:hypothetical protein